jgi:hypothetical protein
MLIVALVMAVIGLAALVTAVVTGNEAIAWVCIGASVIGVVLLIVDALRERQRRDGKPVADDETTDDHDFDAEFPDEQFAEEAPAREEPVSEGEAPDERSDSETSR